MRPRAFPHCLEPDGELTNDVHHRLAPPTPPPAGAFVGSDLSGVVVKLGPNLQKDIKIGDVVGASVVGRTCSPWGLLSSSFEI